MHNISSSCTKSSLTGLFSRVHTSDETQLTHLKYCAHLNKHLVTMCEQNNFITLYCFWMLPNMLESTVFWDTRYIGFCCCVIIMHWDFNVYVLFQPDAEFKLKFKSCCKLNRVRCTNQGSLLMYGRFFNRALRVFKCFKMFYVILFFIRKYHV